MQQSSPATALVTGATGFIGGHLARRLLAEGWRVKLLVRNPAKLSSDLKEAEIVEGDLANIEALKSAVTDVTVIFHCAAKVDSWGTRADYWAVNVMGVKNLLEAVAQNNPKLSRLVHLSTVDVYGFPKKPCDETAPTVATGFAYGDSKIEGEVYLRSFCAGHNIPYTIFRPCNVIGPNSQFIERIGQQLREGLMLNIDKGRANAGLLYIDTLIGYMLAAAVNAKAAGQIYNVREAYDVSWAEFISNFRSSLKSSALVISLPFGVADIFSRLCVLFYRLLMPTKEPVLHPLIIRIFGRSCGHDATKIHAAYTVESLGFAEAMRNSVKWYLQEKS